MPIIFFGKETKAMVTISTHNGSKVCQQHNVRAEKTVSKEEHINPNGIHETWLHETIKHAYHRLFDESVARYNKKQTRDDRKIKDYYRKVEADAKQHPAYEMIIGVYGNDCSEDVGKQIMREFAAGWNRRNPNLELIGAYYHADEQGQPHVHLDYIPVAHGYSKGMDTQAGLVKAFEEMGFKKQGKATAQIQWQARENNILEGICKKHGLEVEHPKEEGRKHLDTESYKAQKALENVLDNTKDLLSAQDDLRAETSRLETIRDKTEKQVEKAIKRKQKAFSKSWKKDRESGWSYDKSLEQEIKELIKDRAKDAEAISHTNFDIQTQYAIAERVRKLTEQKADEKYSQAKKELEEATEYKEKQKAYISRLAQEEADRMFHEFLKKTFKGKSSKREARLDEYASNIKYKDGTSVLDRFERQEKDLEQCLEQSWDDNSR